MRKSVVRRLRKALRVHDDRAAQIEPGRVDERIATFEHRFKRLKKEYTYGRK